MSIAYNRILFGKNLDRAGHPRTPNGDALVAVRMANNHCSLSGKTIGDAVRTVNDDFFRDVRSQRQADLLRKITNLTVARDDAEAHSRAQAETIADLRRALGKSELVIDDLRAELALLRDKLDSQPAPTVDLPVEPILSDVAGGVFDQNGPAVELAPAEVQAKCQDVPGSESDAEPSAPSTTEAINSNASCGTSSPDEVEDDSTCSRWERVRFNALASLGRTRSSIAKTLSREFGGRYSVSRVAEMMRQRWLSPAYLRSFGEIAVTG